VRTYPGCIDSIKSANIWKVTTTHSWSTVDTAKGIDMTRFSGLRCDKVLLRMEGCMSYTGGYPFRPKQLSPGLSVTHQRGKDCGVEEVLDKELPKGTNHGGREGRHKKDV